MDAPKAWRNQTVAAEAKYRERRRGIRLNAFIPVALEWEAGRQQKVRAEAQTRVVSPYGCLVVSPHEFHVQQHVRLTNLATNSSNLAVIVWKGKQRAEGVEFGIELMDPMMGFWGLDL